MRHRNDMRRSLRCLPSPMANNESSEVIDILLPVTFYFNLSTRLDNVKTLWRFVISSLLHSDDFLRLHKGKQPEYTAK